MIIKTRWSEKLSLPPGLIISGKENVSRMIMSPKDEKSANIEDCSICKNQRCRKGRECYPEINGGIVNKYQERDDLEITRAAASVEANHYQQATRLEETRLFAKEMGYTRLGIATCIGLVDEAQQIAQYLKRYFEVYVIVCKNGGLLKNTLGLEQIEADKDEFMCNPIGQALFLNQKETDLNIICGLCVGHDMLFTKYSAAPVTTIIVKDRVLAHNPAAVLYSSYHRKRVLDLK